MKLKNKKGRECYASMNKSLEHEKCKEEMRNVNRTDVLKLLTYLNMKIVKCRREWSVRTVILKYLSRLHMENVKIIKSYNAIFYFFWFDVIHPFVQAQCTRLHR